MRYLDEFLLQRGVNKEIFKNEIFHKKVCDNIIGIIIKIVEKSEKNYYTLNDEERDRIIERYISSYVDVNSNGSISIKPFMEQNNVFSGYIFSVSDTNELISISSASVVNEYEQNDLSVSHFSTIEYVDESGIEMKRVDAEYEYAPSRLTYASALKQAQDSIHYAFKKGVNSKKITTERNQDIGSASCTYNDGNGFVSGGFFVQLYGEHIDTLDWGNPANKRYRDIMNITSSDEFIRYREEHPELEFKVASLIDEEKEKYCEWVNAEIANISNSTTKAALEQMAIQNGINRSNRTY